MIHDTAFVEEGSAVGPGTSVWHGAQIRSGAVIGENCTIGKGVYIDGDVKIGDCVKIQNYACIYGPCRIADEVFIGPHVVITNDHWPRATYMGGGEPIAFKADGLVEIGFRASIGAGAIILPSIAIEKHCMIGAGAVVTESISAHSLAYGVPAMVVHAFNTLIDGKDKDR